MIDFEGRVYCFLGMIALMIILILTGQMDSYNYVMQISLGLLAGIVLPTAGVVDIAKSVVKNDRQE